ncbi:MAG: hypothetical protein Q4A41_06295, partial [Bacillota bacterium]|nr:hypothetical protein [Bacillota bacterium]
LKEQNIEPGESYEKILKKLSESKETSVNESDLPQSGKLKFVTENPDFPEFRSQLLQKGVRVFGVKATVSALYSDHHHPGLSAVFSKRNGTQGF